MYTMMETFQILKMHRTLARKTLLEAGQAQEKDGARRAFPLNTTAGVLATLARAAAKAGPMQRDPTTTPGSGRGAGTAKRRSHC